MTPEDKIIAAIERNTAAIERQTEWLKEEEDDPLLKVVEDIRNQLRIVYVLLIFVVLVLIASYGAKAAPLVSDGDEIASVGTEVRR